MLVFNNQQRSGYEEISSYSPKYYKRIREMDAVFRLAGWLTDIMAADMELLISNQFVPDMNDETLTRYEMFLGIKTDQNKTLDERKSYIMALQVGSGKLSKDKIIAIVNQFVDCKCDIVLKGSALYINMTFENDPSKYMDDIRKLVRGKVPAHIEIIYRGAEGLDIIVTLENTVTVERIRNQATFYLHSNGEASYLDGGVYLDGRAYLCNLFNLYPVRDRHRLDVGLAESFEMEPVTVRRNYHQLDGGLKLDGDTLLNALEWKEDI